MNTEEVDQFEAAYQAGFRSGVEAQYGLERASFVPLAALEDIVAMLTQRLEALENAVAKRNDLPLERTRTEALREVRGRVVEAARRVAHGLVTDRALTAGEWVLVNEVHDLEALEQQ